MLCLMLCRTYVTSPGEAKPGLHYRMRLALPDQSGALPWSESIAIWGIVAIVPQYHAIGGH